MLNKRVAHICKLLDNNKITILLLPSSTYQDVFSTISYLHLSPSLCNSLPLPTVTWPKYYSTSNITANGGSPPSYLVFICFQPDRGSPSTGYLADGRICRNWLSTDRRTSSSNEALEPESFDFASDSLIYSLRLRLSSRS